MLRSKTGDYVDFSSAALVRRTCGGYPTKHDLSSSRGWVFRDMGMAQVLSELVIGLLAKTKEKLNIINHYPIPTRLSKLAAWGKCCVRLPPWRSTGRDLRRAVVEAGTGVVPRDPFAKAQPKRPESYGQGRLLRQQGADE